MLSKTVSRWLAAVGVVGALVAAAMPAQAQGPAVTLTIFFTDQTIAAGSPGKIDSVIVASSKPVVLPDATVTYDATTLAGQVELSSESKAECTTPSEQVLVCERPFEEIELDQEGLAGLFDVRIAPAPTAATGASGTLKITFASTGFTPATHTATVRIGEGVDLAAGPKTKPAARPGQAFSAPVTVRNAGKTAAEGAAVVFFNDFAIEAAHRHSNCTYVGAAVRSCRFDTKLAPGGTYTASLAYALRSDTLAPGHEASEMFWLTPAELEDFTGYLRHNGFTLGTPGNGPALTLSAARAAVAGTPQADTEPTNNFGIVDVAVRGKNGADLVAIGDTLTGRAGVVVTAEVGVVNKGPATVDFNRSDEPVTKLEVAIPAGTTVVGVPDGCEVRKPGARRYLCRSGSFLQVGHPETFAFSLRIDRVVANATGTVKVLTRCDCIIFLDDLNHANNTAKILVNPTGGGGGGGGLPITGTPTGAVAAAGALLLAAGGAGLWFARRRRPRCVA
jgi:LPXTG-motif cell wall-anchored protein